MASEFFVGIPCWKWTKSLYWRFSNQTDSVCMLDFTPQKMKQHLAEREQEYMQAMSNHKEVAKKAAEFKQQAAEFAAQERQSEKYVTGLHNDLLILRQAAKIVEQHSGAVESSPAAVTPKASRSASKGDKARKSLSPTVISARQIESESDAAHSRKPLIDGGERTKLPRGGRKKLQDASARVLGVHAYLKREDLYDLLLEEEELRRDGIKVPGSRGGNFLSSLLSEDARFVSNRKLGWSLKKQSKK